MGGRLEPQPFCFASLNDTQPDGPNFQPFCSIQSVMMIWAAHSRSCKSKAVQLWQKLALDYACQWICREKLKYVKIIRVHWEKRGRTLQCFMVVCYSIFFFQRHKWTEPCILSRWSKTWWEDGPGLSLVSSSHFTCNQRMDYLYYENQQSYLKRCLCWWSCFLLPSQPSFRNRSLGCFRNFLGWPTNIIRDL